MLKIKLTNKFVHQHKINIAILKVKALTYLYKYHKL